jgi:hypothetical protein
MYHATYQDLIKQHWNREAALPNKVSHMEEEFGKWRKDVFLKWIL